MNRTYRTVWNAVTATWIVASELAKGRKTTSDGKNSNVMSLASALALTGFSIAALFSTVGTAEASLNITDDFGTCSSITETGFNAQGRSNADGLCEDRGNKNPGKNIFVYASDGSGASNDVQDSMNIGGNLRVWKTATFNGGIDMQNTQITNMKGGTISGSSTDAINGSQLYGISNSVADAIGGGSTVNADGTISAPSYMIDGTTVHNVGDAITNLDERATTNSTAISNINDTLNNITNNGTGIKYFHANSVLADSQAIGTDSVAIGGNARAQADNSVALGANSVADRANSVSVGAIGSERQITNVAAGTADTDAVNLAQLKAAGLVNGDGTTNAALTYDHNADGSVNYNSMTMGDNVAGGTTIHNVAAGTDSMDAVNVNQMNEAIANVTTIANNSSNPLFTANGSRETEAAVASGNHATAMGANAKASADNSVALGANSVADRANTVSVGAAGSERQIVNVAAGTEATDAVNVEQLNAVVGNAVGNMPAGMTAKDYTDSRISSLQGTVNQVAKNSYAGIAAAMAMPNLTPSAPGKTVVAAGSGAYKSGAAAAVGVTHRSRNGKWLANGALSVTSTGDAGARVQVGYEF
jgi:trimeric autotransporter adhesin